ncbi:MAG TPA: glycosyltransferase family 2 protein [Planctomycetota bacterium]|nr:glycosyltransferase family 2 protein [Planctomycetota bacterium]
MADTGARLAALLLNFRQPELTLQCLQDLLAVPAPALSVLLLDNGSGDGSFARLQAAATAAGARGHVVTATDCGQNLGFAAAMNRGFSWASAQHCDYVLVLNNDLRLPPDCLRPLLEVLQNDPRVVAVGPTVLLPDGRVWAQGGRLGFHANALALRGHLGPPAPTTTGPVAVDFLPGACVLFRTAEVLAVGGFDARYFMYWEDVDLCHRLAARGGTLLWLPWVRVTHAAGSSSGGARSPLRKFMMAANAVRYLRAHGTAAQWAALLLLDLLLWPLALLSGPRAAVAKLRGLVAGCCGHQVSAADVERYLRR